MISQVSLSSWSHSRGPPVAVKAIILLSLPVSRRRPPKNGSWRSSPTTPPISGRFAAPDATKAAEENPNIDVDFQILGDATAAGTEARHRRSAGPRHRRHRPQPRRPHQRNPDAQRRRQAGRRSSAPTATPPDSDRACYIGTNNFDAGKQAGGLIKEVLPNGGKIMLFVGNLDAQNAKDRSAASSRCWTARTSRSSTSAPTTPTASAPRPTSQDTLVKYPDIACLVGLWSYNGPAILERRQGRRQKRAGQDRLLRRRRRNARRRQERRHLRHRRPAALRIRPSFHDQPGQGISMATNRSFPTSKQIFIPTLAIKKDNVDEFRTN